MHWLQLEEDVYLGDGGHRKLVDFGSVSDCLQSFLDGVLLFTGKNGRCESSLLSDLSRQLGCYAAFFSENVISPTDS